MDFIPIAKPYIGEEEAEAVYRQVKSGWISMGQKVKEFENAVCEYLGVTHAIAMNSGTATLHAALIALGVGPGDEVILPTLSFISSANAVISCKATPVFCEVDPRTFNVTSETMQTVMTSRTKVLMPVDLKGQPVDYDTLNKLANESGIAVLSDSAESFGAIYKGHKTGGQCRVHSFSFFANKSITTGEGGVVTTDDAEVAEKCQLIRTQGQSERYVHVDIGYNYRLTDVSAALGVAQLGRIEWIMEEKERIAKSYNGAFAGHPLIKVPSVPEYVNRPSWYMYCLTLDKRINKDNVLKLMKTQGVDYRLSFPPIHLQPIYRKLFNYHKGDFPISEAVFNRFIDIPCWVGMTQEQMERVVKVVISSVERSEE